MNRTFRRVVLTACVCAVPVMASAQSSDNRYGSWAPPGSATAPGASQANVDGLLGELDKLIKDAEASRAANPVFLRDLKDLAARYRNSWGARVFFDDFNDGDYQLNPAWTVTSGDYFVEQGYGLRARPTEAVQDTSAPSQPQQLSKEQLAISILGAVLGGKQSGGEASAQPQAQTQARPAVIETRARIPNSFSATAQISSWKGEGQFELAVTQGVGGAGYRVVYNPGPQAVLELVSVTSRGRGVIDSKQVTRLEDQKVHSLQWVRQADGAMTVSLDGSAVLSARDTSFRDPFDGLTISQQGSDIIVKSVEIVGAR